MEKEATNGRERTTGWKEKAIGETENAMKEKRL